MIERNSFQVHRKKNETKSSHFAKLTVFALLLLSPNQIQTQAIDSPPKLRGRENDLGKISSESIADSVVHVSFESDSIGLSTGEEEKGSSLSHITHESSMLDDAQVEEVKSIDMKSSNVPKSNISEQAKMASDQSLSMTSTSTPTKPNGMGCALNDQCYSGNCLDRKCQPAEPITPGSQKVGEYCNAHQDCETGLCSFAHECYEKVECNYDKPNGSFCYRDCECESDLCLYGLSWMGGECEPKDWNLSPAPSSEPLPDGAPNGERCWISEGCQSGRCHEGYCVEQLPNGADCNYDYDCLGGKCSSDRKCEDNPLPPSPSETPCFSSETLVTHSERGLIPISEIEVGDYIKSDTHGSFSRVYALKKNHYKDTEFYQLHSKSGILLEATDRHMVFLKNKSLPIAARDVRVGDVLKSEESSKDDTEVTKIEIVRREGYYNPFTESGTFVLNDGVVASSYDVSSSSSSNFFDTETELIHWHSLGNLACAPLRFVCKAVDFGLCSDAGNQNEDGLHKFIVFLTTLRKLKDWQQVAVVPIVMIMGVLFTVFDLVYDKAEALLEVVSPTGAGLLTFSLVTALAVPGLLALRKRYFL